MTPPILGLLGLTILVLVHVGVAALLLKGSVGNAWTIGPRDTPRSPGLLAGRAQRATANLTETAPAFIAAVLAAELSGRTGAMISLSILAYLFGRTLYLPAYLSGIPWVRTLFWWIATGAIVALVIGIAFA